ncbi:MULTISPECIES: hypothetical protein [unclassified Microcoleus]|uniref:hypothetical protein n=1 Tax=unclassified Microcoleus TaxID=2642155 RepID=UPI002FD3CB12
MHQIFDVGARQLAGDRRDISQAVNSRGTKRSPAINNLKYLLKHRSLEPSPIAPDSLTPQSDRAALGHEHHT